MNFPNGMLIPGSANFRTLTAGKVSVDSQRIKELAIDELVTNEVNCNLLNAEEINGLNINASVMTTDTINGILPQAHASRHAFNGADPLTPATISDITEVSDFLSSPGTNDTRIPRADHVHAHGQRGGGNLHATATTLLAGFMSSADKAKVDGMTPSDQGPQSLGVTDPGDSAEYSRADHVHAHGSLGGGSLHSDAIANGASGFMSGADKAKLDGMTPSDASPANIGTTSPGASSLYSRSDHVHAHGNQLGGTLHANAVANGAAGFMTGTDKAKLDGITPSDANPANIGTTSPGTSSLYSRSDHVHAHGNQLGGTLHANAVASGAAGFMTGADKAKLDNIPAGLDSYVQYNNGGTVGGSANFTWDDSTDTLYATNAVFDNLPEIPLTNGEILIGSITNSAASHLVSGDATLSNTGTLTLASVNGGPGATTLSSVTTNAKGLVTSNASATLASTNFWVGNGSSVPTARAMSGDATMANTGAVTLATVNAGPGATTLSSVTTNAKGLVTTNSSATLASTNFWVGNVSSVPTAVAMSGDATMANTGAVTLVTVNAGPGTTTLSSVTTNAKGLVTTNTSATLASTNFWVGNGSSVPTAVAMSGDATMANTGAVTLATVNGGPGATTLSSVTTNAKGLVTTNASATLADSKIWIGNVGSVPTAQSVTGDATLGNTGALTLATVNVSSGSTTLSSITTNAKGLVQSNTSATLASTNFWVGNGSSVPTAVAMSGDATMANTGVVTLATVGPTKGGTGQSTYTLGDTLYSSASNTLAKLAGNTSTTKQYLSQTGNGTVSAAPAWAAVAGADVTGAALTKVDDTNVTLTLGGTPATSLLRAASITAGWTGQLGVTRGGTGLASVAQGDLLYGSAANTVSALAKNTTATRYLGNTGTTNNPAWTQIDLTNGVTGALGATNGGTGQSTYTLGDTLYSSAGNVLSKLSGNTSTTKQYLSQTGNGSVSAAPVWAAIAGADVTGSALTKADDTNVTLTLGGTPATSLLRAASITAGWTGQLGVTRGGTGLASVAQGDLLYASASNTVSALAKDTNATRYLSNTGTTNNPAWAQINLANGVTGTLPAANVGASGSTTQVQYNNSGVLGASSSLTWDNSNTLLTATNINTNKIQDIFTAWTQNSSSPLIGTSSSGASEQGISVALSGDGNTAAVGGYKDNSGAGAVWIYIKNADGTWSQQGSKLVGTGATGAANQGTSVALSYNGNIIAIGGEKDNTDQGAVWIWTRSGTTWTQTNKLVGTGNTGAAKQGHSVALSSDGLTVAWGGISDNTNTGATWVWVNTTGTWAQQGSKLVGTTSATGQTQGRCISLSADGNTLAVGADGADSGVGATWIFTRSGTTWTQAQKLSGSGNSGNSLQGVGVALSGDGNYVAIGGQADVGGATGATWIFIKNSSGTWTQQGSKLVGSASSAGNQGASVSISYFGNVVIIGGPVDNSSAGSVWVFVRNGTTWVQQTNTFISVTGGTGFPTFGRSVSVSYDGNTFIGGANQNNSSVGAAWILNNSSASVANDLDIIGTATIPILKSNALTTSTLNILTSGVENSPTFIAGPNTTIISAPSGRLIWMRIGSQLYITGILNSAATGAANGGVSYEFRLPGGINTLSGAEGTVNASLNGGIVPISTFIQIPSVSSVRVGIFSNNPSSFTNTAFTLSFSLICIV